MATLSVRRCLPALLVAFGTVTAGMAIAPPARAQDVEPPRRRQGYYLTAGLGTGAIHDWDEGEGLGVMVGSKFSFRMGQLVTRRLGLGLLIESAAAKKNSLTAGQFGLGLEGNVQLWKNLALRANVGLGILQINDEADTDPDKKLRGTYGAQYGIGLSYDWFPGSSTRSGGFAVTPTLDLRTLPGDTAASVAAFIGVEVAWWTGLPRNQLELPESEAYKK